MLQQIVCSQCNQVIPAADINLDRMLAKCAACNTVQSIDAPAAPVVATASASRKPAQVYKPDNTQMSQREGRLELIQRWYNPIYFGLLFFCCFWDGFLFFWYAIALSQPHPPLMMVLFPLGHVAVGVVLTYTVLCGFFNKTCIRAGMGELSVTHGPLPAPGRQLLSTRDLEQLYCEQHFGSKGSVNYHLMALLKNGKKVRLIANLKSADEARYLERQVEDHLKIKDREVSGEFLG